MALRNRRDDIPEPAFDTAEPDVDMPEPALGIDQPQDPEAIGRAAAQDLTAELLEAVAAGVDEDEDDTEPEPVLGIEQSPEGGYDELVRRAIRRNAEARA